MEHRLVAGGVRLHQILAAAFPDAAQEDLLQVRIKGHGDSIGWRNDGEVEGDVPQVRAEDGFLAKHQTADVIRW